MNLTGTLKANPVWREAKDYLLIALGMMMYGIGWTVFLLPNNLPSGAVPGIASIIYWATGFPVQFGYQRIFAVAGIEDSRVEVLHKDHLGGNCTYGLPGCYPEVGSGRTDT